MGAPLIDAEVPASAIALKPDGTIIFASKTTSSVFGVDVAGARRLDIVPPGCTALREDGSEYDPATYPIARTCATRQVIRGELVTLLNPAGERRVLRCARSRTCASLTSAAIRARQSTATTRSSPFRSRSSLVRLARAFRSHAAVVENVTQDSKTRAERDELRAKHAVACV